MSLNDTLHKFTPQQLRRIRRKKPLTGLNVDMMKHIKLLYTSIKAITVMWNLYDANLRVEEEEQFYDFGYYKDYCRIMDALRHHESVIRVIRLDLICLITLMPFDISSIVNMYENM